MRNKEVSRGQELLKRPETDAGFRTIKEEEEEEQEQEEEEKEEEKEKEEDVKNVG